MKLFSWKKKETECGKCVVLERKLLGMCDGMTKVMLDLDTRLKKLEAKKKPLPKKKRPQPVFKSKHN